MANTLVHLDMFWHCRQLQGLLGGAGWIFVLNTEGVLGELVVVDDFSSGKGVRKDDENLQASRGV